jgi:signal peptidase II
VDIAREQPGNGSLPTAARRAPWQRIAAGALAAVVGLALLIPPAFAEDRVTLKRGPLAGRITITGTIEDYTGEELRIHATQGETVRTFAAAEVLSVETPHEESHDRGLGLIRENRLDEAREALEAALKQEVRKWVRREILAELTRCALRQGDYPTAGQRFLSLLKSDSTTRHFGLIPLVWASEPIPDKARAEGRVWLGGTDEAARLIGASLLLEDPVAGTAAREALRGLSMSPDRRIQLLAQMQAWRTETGPIGDLQIARWQERVDALPPSLRAGPSFLLGQAYAARHDFELAAASWLWLPLVDDHDFRLSARACLEAGTALGRIGQQAEAQGLYREVTVRYAETTFAEEARRLLHGTAARPDSN